MAAITRELLQSYLEDALGDSETAAVEQALRDSEPLQRQLRGNIPQAFVHALMLECAVRLSDKWTD